jgi:uncharacterized membrane protein SpoIIM required for sporulation
MLPELILREEHEGNYPLLFGLGLLSVFIAFLAAGHLFPPQADFLVVIFSAIPLVYPLTSFFLDDEKKYAPHFPEVANYFSLFLGQVAGFFMLGLDFPGFFTVQKQVAGITGNAIAPDFFLALLVSNMAVFLSIAVVSFVVGSAGAFILAWNASVLGVFLADLVSRLEGVAEYLLGSGKVPSPLAYVPHATFEMTGFILAGISGSLMSAAFYREHFDRKHWTDFAKLLVAGAFCIVIGAMLESTGR